MYNSIFQKKWWLDAVSPNSWDVIEIKRDEKIIARMAYVIIKKNGFIFITHPPLTQTLGIWIFENNVKYAKKISLEKDIMYSIIKQLPKFDFFQQSFHFSITNWLPFYWHGFQQTTKYTYVIDDLSNLNLIWDNFLDNIRTDIKKAINRFGIKIRTDLSIDNFLDVNEKTFKRQGINMPYTREFIYNLDKACLNNNSRKIFFALDQSNKIHAAVYLVWDEMSAYCLMVGNDPELRKSGATSLCIWEAIKFASTVSKKFDFEGSMMESVERYYRAFGAKQIPYYHISKTNSILLLLRQLISKVFKILKNRNNND
jgi:hypothetical protein